MKRFVFALLGILILPASVIAQTCSPATDASGAILTSQFGDLTNKARRAQARLDAQSFQSSELSDAQRAALSPAPTIPALAEGYFDGDAAILWACDANGDPTPTIAAYETALAEYEESLSAFETTVRARAAEITAALEGATIPPAVADGTPAGAPGTGGSDTAQAEPPAGGGDIVQSEPPADGRDTAQAEPPAAQPGGADAPVPRATPLTDADNPNLFRRVISLPNAKLHASADETAAAEALPTFSVMYVFDETTRGDTTWLQVATSLREGDQGWVQATETLDWTSMLVMEFSSKGRREEVLFFEDDQALADIVSSFSYAAEAGELYSGIASERQRLNAEPGTQPQWDQRLVAIEPQTAVTFSNDPYLLPILDWREELFDGTIETTLLQVAAVPADAEVIQQDDRSNPGSNLQQAALNDGVFRVGVVFVVDTTISMRPFIERTYQTIETFYDSFQEMETAQFVSFGLVGFRDSIASNPALEYVTRNFQPLDPEADASLVLTNMRQMVESPAPTIGFKEDSFSGIVDALGDNDWRPFDARIIVLVTDASARTGADSLMEHSGQTPESIAEIANGNNTAIIPVHLLTPANQANGDAAIAESQYRAISEATGVEGSLKYIPLDAINEDLFLAELKKAARGIAGAVLTVNSGDVLDVELEEIPTEPSLAAAIRAEIFRAQLESLAVAADGSAPNFLAGWASDKDLKDPNLQALEVKVFLTRNQLSTLDKRMGDILDAFRSGGDDPNAFFENLQNLAAQTATDPDLVRSGMDDRAAMQALMPAFLANLPYKSEILDLDREFWGSLSVAQRSEFIERLDGKRKIYEATFANTDIWQDFGAEDPSLQVTAVRLSSLP